MGNCVVYIKQAGINFRNRKTISLDIYKEKKNESGNENINNEINKNEKQNVLKKEASIESISNNKVILINGKDNYGNSENNSSSDEFNTVNNSDEYVYENNNNDDGVDNDNDDDTSEDVEYESDKKDNDYDSLKKEDNIKENNKVILLNNKEIYTDNFNNISKNNNKTFISSDIIKCFDIKKTNLNYSNQKYKQERLLHIKYNLMLLNDITDIDIVVVFLYSLFLYFNANNIVDIFDKTKKSRYKLINPLNVGHDMIFFPSLPKEIIDNFLKGDFTLLKKYIKNKCNKLKKYKKKMDRKKNNKKTKLFNFKYDIIKKDNKCTFSNIIESFDLDQNFNRYIVETLSDDILPDFKILYLVMGAYGFYENVFLPFQDKNIFIYKSPLYNSDIQISYSCKKGRKFDTPNQDDFIIIVTDEWILMMVFDGHGVSGHDISNFVHVIFPLIFCYNINQIYQNPVYTIKTIFYMVNCYLINYSYCINNNINPININYMDCNFSGTTCTLILYNKINQKIYSAHTGDSRAVMGKCRQKKYIAYNITQDHKPFLKMEKKRIISFGGEVKKLQGDVPYRVFMKHKKYPGLAMSRAIGDLTSAHIGVTCEPTIKILNKNEEDKFIILATDGIWEFLSSEECVQMVFKNSKKKIDLSVKNIIKEAWKRWEKIDTVDDMTLAILYF